MREVAIVPVLPGGPVEVVVRNLAPESPAVLAEGNAEQERGLTGQLEQPIDAAGGFQLVGQEDCGGTRVAEGAVGSIVSRHVEAEPVAQGLVAVRGRVWQKMFGGAAGADPGRGRPCREHGSQEGEVELCVVGGEGNVGMGEGLEGRQDVGQGRRLAGDHFRGDVVHGGGLGRNRYPGIDKGMEDRVKLAVPAVDPDDGNFDDAVGRWVETGGLEVNDKSGSIHVHSLF